ncbi:MAG TPA: serine/threonine-protein kinase [Myxococcales bacterium]|jgi:serine/threonine-protein kinase|nr:serine/threonine-protein kinase [Myxococcales bacterium]
MTAKPRFGRYEILQLLGRGGMAEVYKARITEGARAEEIVALKRLTPKLTNDPEAVDLFCGEADVSVMLKHPHIVEVFEAGVVGDVYYLAMEYVDGRDLALILARCRERNIFLPMNFAVHIALAALDALAYAHKAAGPTGMPLNIVHCDVSPSNLFISRLGEIKLGDFGIAKVRSLDEVQDATVWGKLAYLAPEQLQRQPLTPQVDLWGAAAILYECLTNQRAIRGSNEEMMAALQAGRIAGIESLRPDVPPGLSDVVHKALQINPSARYATAEEFSAALLPFHDEISGGALGIASVVRGLFKA